MQIKDTPIDQIRPYENNPRHNEGAISKVAASIAEFGFQQPIVVDGAGIVIVGHTRLAAAKQLGLQEVPVLEATELTPEQVKAYRIADNRTNEDASWNDQLLLEEITGLMEGAYDIELLGFTDEEIQAIQASRAVRDGATDPDDIPEPEGVVITRTGDIWECGRHRVVCGDSTSVEPIAAALQGRRADMVWIDPPYNVDYKNKGQGGAAAKKKFDRKRGGVIKNDAVEDSEFSNFLTDTLLAHIKNTKEGGCIYMACQDINYRDFSIFMDAAGWDHKQTIIWVKNQMVLGRQDYNLMHEPILYGWKPGAAHYFVGDYTLTTLIDDDIDASKLNKQQLLERYQTLERQLYNTVHRENRPDVSDVHPTMKPVALVERHIEASSRPGQTILDGFGGSGTTLIAAEKNARNAALVEIDTGYVDVIIRRWQAWTEQAATLQSTGQTFKEVSDGRTKTETNAA